MPSPPQYGQRNQLLRPVRTKSLFRSKTFWLNAASLAAAVAHPTPETQGLVAVANVVLRLITSQGVHVIKES